MSKYRILYKGTPLQKHRDKPIPDGLTEEQMFSIMDDLSESYFQVGKPDPQDLKVEIIKEEN